MLSHLSIRMKLYNINSINAIPDFPFPQVRGYFCSYTSEKWQKKSHTRRKAKSCTSIQKKVEQRERRRLLPDEHGESYVPLLKTEVEQAAGKAESRKIRTRKGWGTSDTLRHTSKCVGTFLVFIGFRERLPVFLTHFHFSKCVRNRLPSHTPR